MCRTQFELERAIAKERARLLLLAPKDQPNGEYAAPVFGAGAVDSPVMLVGEAPGAEETKQAVPFVGKAGKQLDALLQMTGIPRSFAANDQHGIARRREKRSRHRCRSFRKRSGRSVRV